MISLLLLKRRPENTAELVDQLRSIQSVPPTETAPEPSGPTAPVTVGVPEGDIVTRYGRPPLELSDAIKRYWSPSQWVNAAEVSHIESAGWNPRAELNTLHIGPCGTRYYLAAIGGYAQTEDSVGYFQINICAHGGTREYWYDADNNVRKAAELYRAAGWSPWTVTAHRLGLL